MVSRSQHQQGSTIVHSSGASNSSGSTTAVAAPPEPPTTSKSPLQLLRRSRNSVAAKMKLSSLFRSSNKQNINTNRNDATTTNATNDLNRIESTTISSVIVTMDTNLEEKQRDMANTTVWMESLYHSEMPAAHDDGVLVENSANPTITSADNMGSANDGEVGSVDGGLYSEGHRTEMPPPPPPRTNGPLFCNGGVGVPFFDRMCHIGRTGSEDSDAILSDSHIKRNFHNTLPDDPSIQESFECFFMAQQESMLKEQQKDQKQEHQQQQQSQPNVVDTVHTVTNNSNRPERTVTNNDDRFDHSNHIQTPPSMIHQSLLKNRSISRLPIQFQRDVIARSPRSSLQQQEHQQQHPGTAATLNMFQQRIPPPDNNGISTSNRNSMDRSALKDESKVQHSTAPVSSTDEDRTSAATTTSTTASCICCQRQLPLLEPDHWPQRPLLLRPTPNSGTRIRGIRFVSSSKEYLWQADQTDSESLTWPQALRKHWEKDTDVSKLPPPTPTSPNPKSRTMCSQCMILPINNGKELPGESLVSDFESELFIGTILVRLKDCHGTTIPNQVREQTNGGYFQGLHRRYQVVIRGQFKQSLPWTECMVGFQYVSTYLYRLWVTPCNFLSSHHLFVCVDPLLTIFFSIDWNVRLVNYLPNG